MYLAYSNDVQKIKITFESLVMIQSLTPKARDSALLVWASKLIYFECCADHLPKLALYLF